MRKLIEIKKDYTLRGTLDLPQLSIDGKAPLVIFFHDFLSSSRVYPSDMITQLFIKYAYSVLRIDFNGHGRSDRRLEETTLESLLEDARDMIEYAHTLEFVSDIILIGHGQGGVIASIIAKEYPEISSLILMAPTGNLEDDIKNGCLKGIYFNKKKIPNRIVIENQSISKDFLIELSHLHVYKEAEGYQGSVCLLYGDNDQEVTFPYIKRYQDLYQTKHFHQINTDHTFRISPKETLYWIEQFINK